MSETFPATIVDRHQRHGVYVFTFEADAPDHLKTRRFSRRIDPDGEHLAAIEAYAGVDLLDGDLPDDPTVIARYDGGWELDYEAMRTA